MTDPPPPAPAAPGPGAPGPGAPHDTAPATPIRVLLVDDDALVRTGLSRILGAAPDLEVVGEVADGAGVLSTVDAHRPDVVVMDVRMPQVDGITATRALCARPGAPAVLVLTTFHLDAYVFGALEAGAGGFLLKDTPPDELADAVRTVAAGDAMLSPADTRALVDRFTGGTHGPRAEAARAELASLSERELEVATLVGRGLSNAEISRELFCAESTVKAHLGHIFAKLDVTNRVRVAILVHDAGLDRA